MSDWDEIERRACEVGQLIPEQYPSHLDVGEEWLWWHVEKQCWRRVELLEVAEGRPQRVKVQHLDPDMGARAAWSPIKRCRVPWNSRDAYIDSLDRLSRAVGHPFDEDERDAATDIVLEGVPSDVAFIGYKPGGTLEVDDPIRLSSLSGVSVTELLGHPDTYRDADGWLIPWPVAKRVAVSLAQRDPLRFVRAVAREELETGPRIDASIEELIRDGRADLAWITDEEKEEVARKSLARSEGKRAVILEWVGGARPSLGQEYRRLSGQYRELARMAAEAVPELRSRRTKSAATLADRIDAAVRVAGRMLS
ncbi:hypothetical protein CBF90_09770 [Microbacterium sp. AISO3]|uniref:hypothetical protein n=1 Tax=Microbacterium sp. AISO3 TaxID=2002831 RepID=UPI000B4D81C8|nr:hypothetical protein [Microbacterium sp. AISO3]OWP21958.1 hypothetical protein CBF90_09770 [Microbacterium sp. AISO3]